MYEHKKQPLAPLSIYRKRLLRSGVYMLGILGCSLLVGIVGYKYTCGYSWVDSLLNASMILGGMGPMNPINNDWGKVFASFYAIFCGVMLLTSIGVLFTPVLHRIYHSLHIDDVDIDEEDK
jgi:hypothetical protein